MLWLKSWSEREVSYHPVFIGSCPTISHTFFALYTKWMSSPLTKWGGRISLRFHLIVFVFAYSIQLLWAAARLLVTYFLKKKKENVTPVVDAFSSDRVTFRISLNINNGAPLRKQPTALTCRLFPQKRSTKDFRPDSKCGSDWRCCE